ncbi:MAG TPA: CHASE2 domain-containing protein [Coleofasciculaceae cyanobacterium]
MTMWVRLRQWIKQGIKQGRGIWVTAPSVAAVIILLRLAGTLQLLELAALDQLFRWRPLEPPDSRIVLVTINESDINALGGWPMSDAVLARLLQLIKQQQPSAIGLDIFRNLPVGAGHQQLVDIFTSTPNLIGIEKVIKSAAGEEVKAPPPLDQRGQVGDNDLLLDPDGRIRRGLLYLRSPKQQPVLGLGAKLAFLYLAKHGITPQIIDRSQNRLRLGRAVLSPLQADDGGYIHVDDRGYQILSNFRRLPKGFQTLSMTDVLQGKLPPDLAAGGSTPFRDRIVLIGLTADSLEDRFYTAFSTNLGTASAGVEIHAQIASQLLSAALDGRPLLQSWTEPLEWLWIVIWSGMGAVLGWTSSSPQRTLVRLLLLSMGLMSLAYLLFLAGWWLIVVPPLLALAVSTTLSSGWLLWKNLSLSHHQLEEYAETLEEKIQARTVELEQEKELLQAIVDHIPVMMALYDAEGQLYFVNQELEKVLGWSNAEIKTIDLIAECFPEPAYRHQVWEHMMTTNGKWQDFNTRSRNGHYLEASWANIQLSNGIKIRIGQDISERLAASRRERQQAEEASVLDERNRMAREIHDTLAQALTGILVHLETVLEEIPVEPEIAQSHVEIVQDLARTGLTEARRSVAALRPQLLENRDLSAALNRLTTQMAVSTQQRLIYQTLGTAYPLLPEVENNLLRIAQEALTNAIKYANASEIRIELRYDSNQCLLRIKDNGQGFDIGSAPRGSGFGLLGISERVKYINGELAIQSQPGQGTEVVVIIHRESISSGINIIGS